MNSFGIFLFFAKTKKKIKLTGNRKTNKLLFNLETNIKNKNPTNNNNNTNIATVELHSNAINIYIVKCTHMD